jgi:hypothetical protein
MMIEISGCRGGDDRYLDVELMMIEISGCIADDDRYILM